MPLLVSCSGDLALSRSVGDFQYKDEHILPEKQKVTAFPDVSFYERTPDDEVNTHCSDVMALGPWRLVEMVVVESTRLSKAAAIGLAGQGLSPLDSFNIVFVSPA